MDNQVRIVLEHAEYALQESFEFLKFQSITPGRLVDKYPQWAARYQTYLDQESRDEERKQAAIESKKKAVKLSREKPVAELSNDERQLLKEFGLL